MALWSSSSIIPEQAAVTEMKEISWMEIISFNVSKIIKLHPAGEGTAEVVKILTI